MKKLIVFVVSLSLLTGCSKKNRIAPVLGTINGNPAVSLYGVSNKPTDFMLIDTVKANRKVQYDGIVFSYLYNSDTTIYLMSGNTPAAQLTIKNTGTALQLTVDHAYTLTFGSTDYISR